MTDNITAYRDQLAAERGISDTDRDLLMTGTTEDILLRQADLLEPLPDLTKGNRAPREGRNVNAPTIDRTMRDFARAFFDENND